MPTPLKHADRAARQRAYRQRQKEQLAADFAAKSLPPTAPLPAMPSNARWAALTERARHSLEIARDEMQTYFDERSEQWQESERAEEFQEKIDKLESILQDLEELE